MIGFYPNKWNLLFLTQNIKDIVTALNSKTQNQVADMTKQAQQIVVCKFFELQEKTQFLQADKV